MNNNAGDAKHKSSRSTENVLVLQGGGSLGAFGCGVVKALQDSRINLDIVGGTSIGAVNAAIICGSKSGNPAKDLQNFWLEVAESSFQVFPNFVSQYQDYLRAAFNIGQIPASALSSVFFGVPKLFVPVWLNPFFPTLSDREQISQRIGENQITQPRSAKDWTYYYDHTPLARTLDSYVDYTKLSGKRIRNNASADSVTNPRLIMTAVNVLTARSVVFDSARMEIEPKHILASAAYSAYGFPWVRVDDDTYAWDGSLLSNTPLKEIVEASPRNYKNVFIVENYPRAIDKLPANMYEVLDRTRDIIFSDKTIYDLRAWNHMSRQTELIEKLYGIFETCSAALALDNSLIAEIKTEYENLVGRYGAEIVSIHRIARDRMEAPYILKNADFSVKTIKDLIAQGQRKTEEHLKGQQKDIELFELTKLLYLE